MQSFIGKAFLGCEKKRFRFVFLLFVVPFLLGGSSKVQKKPTATPPSDQPPIRVQVDLVYLHAAVFDKNGRPVQGMKQSDFKVYEDKVEQQIAKFGPESDTPVTVGILIDSSGSMGQAKIDKAIDAVKVLAATLSPRDEIFLMGFTDQPYLLEDFVPASTDLNRPLSRLFSKGATSVGAAVEEGLWKMRDASNRKQALVVISDGLDIPGRGVEDKIRSHETLVYAIGLKGIGGVLGAWAHMQAMNVRGTSLKIYADESGGRAIFVKDLDEIAQACRDIVFDLKGQYAIAYYPSNTARNGKYRRIKVLIDHPEYSLQYRRGYYAPRH
ncbi:MAG: VWA domain-containing protein [Acidobacteriia bacterium]|nr:VWA domain-containing protein [Terriglobia bacterium]